MTNLLSDILLSYKLPSLVYLLQGYTTSSLMICKWKIFMISYLLGCHTELFLIEFIHK